MARKIIEESPPNTSALKANPKNPRKISDEQRARLKKSLEALGDLSGVVYNVRTKRLVGGHRRSEELPPDSEITIIEKYDRPTPAGTIAIGFITAWGERFNYREVDWDIPTETAAMLGANKHGGIWDEGLLIEHFMFLDNANIDLDLTGFQYDEIENMVAPTDEPPNVPTHTDTHSFTFSIRCRSDEEIIRIRDFFGVLQSGCEFSDFEERCL